VASLSGRRTGGSAWRPESAQANGSRGGGPSARRPAARAAKPGTGSQLDIPIVVTFIRPDKNSIAGGNFFSFEFS